MSTRALRRVVRPLALAPLGIAVAAALAAWQPGCGGDTAVSTPDASAPLDGTTPDDSPSFGDVPVSQLTIDPPAPVVDVQIIDGVMTTIPLTLTALSNGVATTAAWSVDRGELGAIDAGGIFKASGAACGQATVTARTQLLTATATLTVRLHMVQNGKPQNDAGVGGVGGVGGEGLGGPVPAVTVALLRGKGQAPSSPGELGWLYPYDQTVWPRGLLPPLLQWQTSHTAGAVYVHLKQKAFEFEGFYSGAALVHQPIDGAAWSQATGGNTGDPLRAELTIADGASVFGPISEDWTVAPGILKGTVYYTEYSNSNPRYGAEMAIKPGAGAPSYATPNHACHACHEVSADGSTLFETVGGTNDGVANDLGNNGQVIATYAGVAADSTSNSFKFTFSAPYPDGTFAMASSRYTLGGMFGAGDDSYLGDSQLFRRSDATMVKTTGWSTAVTTAVTPAFSPDGKHLAFNFREGTTTNGVAPGAGHTLAVMDFNCGSVDGGTGCGSPPYAFSNLRQLYSDPQRVPGWPAFFPDESGVAFHLAYEDNLCTGTGCGSLSKPPAELWWASLPPNPQTPAVPVRLDALNGLRNGTSYLPTNPQHVDDARLNYKPTVVPIAVGGYSWVVFMSRRMYGNVATGAPFARADNSVPCLAKLWVAAIDLHPTPGKDPSHPAFYLPGQDLMRANLHGFWAPDPCQVNGTACTSGDACCGGFCRTVDGGAICTDKPEGCAHEFEKCSVAADCCGASQGIDCVNGRCALLPH